MLLWAKDPTIGNRMINARVEALSIPRALETRKYIKPANGICEYQAASAT